MIALLKGQQIEVSQRPPSIPILFLQVLLVATCGSLTYNIYPVVVNIAALVTIIGVYFLALHREDYFSFLVLVFFSNHYPLALSMGGVFNLAAFVSVTMYALLYRPRNDPFFLRQGSYGTILIVFLVVQVLSVLAGPEFAMGEKAKAIFFFLEILVLFYFFTKVVFYENHFEFLLKFIGVFLIYMFVVSINQKFELITSNLAIFPMLDKDVEYELNITRCAGTLINFEAYSEYCLSVIALFLPGTLTTSFKSKGTAFYVFSLIVIFIAILSIVLSGTRSSMVLLPLLVIASLLLIKGRLNVRAFLVICISGLLLWTVNAQLKVIDFDVFAKRSESITSGQVTMKGMMSGDEINRGSIFKYAAYKIEHSNLLIGEGYFTTGEEYTYVHFDKHASLIGDAPDYHNLYMSTLVVWGLFGLFFILYIFGSNIIAGYRVYKAGREGNAFLADLLLGFCLMFTFFLINQLKIQFIREPSYFLLVLTFLAIFKGLIDFLTTKLSVKSATVA